MVALQPGFYADGPGLDALTNRDAPNFCGDVVLWLQPGPGNTVGRFYFDLGFFDPDAGATWRMNTGAVVGGAPTGWDPNAGTSQVGRVQSLIGDAGSCDRTRNGVELVFGDRSRVRFRGPAALELCPVARGETAVGQAISISGRKTGDAPSTSVSATPNATASGGGFTWPVGQPSPAPIQAQDCGGNGPCAPGRSITGTLTGRQVGGTLAMGIPYPVENRRPARRVHAGGAPPRGRSRRR